MDRAECVLMTYCADLLSLFPVGPVAGGGFDGDGVEFDVPVVTPGIVFEAVVFILSLMPQKMSPKARAAPIAIIIPTVPIPVPLRVAGSMRRSPRVVSVRISLSRAGPRLGSNSVAIFFPSVPMS